jgi:hypothetical protein
MALTQRRGQSKEEHRFLSTDLRRNELKNAATCDFIVTVEYASTVPKP